MSNKVGLSLALYLFLMEAKIFNSIAKARIEEESIKSVCLPIEARQVRA